MRALFLSLALGISACTPSADAPAPPPGTLATDVDSVIARSIVEPAGPAEAADTAAMSVPPTAELASPNPTEDPSPARPADQRYALLVGINDYPGEDEDLPSGLLDVAAMQEVLIERFGYRPENILMLTDRRASRGQIRRAFREHLAQAGADGSAVFYFSGHGLQTDGNRGPDVEADGQDEAIYVWADRGERGSTILDDEIGVWANGLATDHVLVVLDACHSGTGTRGPEGWINGLAPKGVRYADVAPTLDAPARGSASPTALRHTLLAAARDHEIALSGLPGDPSLFTEALTAALREADLSIGLADLMRGVRRSVQARSQQYRSRHTPQFDGRAQTVGDVLGPSPPKALR